MILWRQRRHLIFAAQAVIEGNETAQFYHTARGGAYTTPSGSVSRVYVSCTAAQKILKDDKPEEKFVIKTLLDLDALHARAPDIYDEYITMPSFEMLATKREIIKEALPQLDQGLLYLAQQYATANGILPKKFQPGNIRNTKNYPNPTGYQPLSTSP
jgi:hypothetical protein